ncbi:MULTISPECIES: YfhD family protein [unclassified Paenibacillus]|uniref:YfhD family protein n=1 Tax=unclassified Paenibacillus TaxID=185978 RepID=UPI001C125D1B|nr:MULTISPECIES: YfhD family protein [unclassified Paenibacillus]MBU5440440.1 YfhD family protein [Paenibacillus sp. MSJ-34]CAH0119638.1 hypothetical protein PAE9249_02143 [Paenibacillus sp. CECT 9249]
MNNNNGKRRANPNNRLPVAKNEDVEFAQELADQADVTAQRRAAEADRRQEAE